MTSSDSDRDEQIKLGIRLKELREYLKLSQQYVTDKTGILRSAVSDIEKGKRRVDSIELKRLAKIYQSTASQLLDEEEKVNSSPLFDTLKVIVEKLSEQDQKEVLRFANFLLLKSNTNRNKRYRNS